MKLPAIVTAPLPTFIERVRTAIGWMTGQAKNSPVLPVLDPNTASLEDVVNAYNLVRQRLDGQD